MQSLADSDFTKMLQDPFQEHLGLTVVTPTIFDLLCVFNQLPALVSTNGIGLPAAKNCVLHAAIFHILGGYGANLPPPPRTSAEARTPAFAITRTLFTQKQRASRQSELLSLPARRRAQVVRRRLRRRRSWLPCWRRRSTPRAAACCVPPRRESGHLMPSCCWRSGPPQQVASASGSGRTRALIFGAGRRLRALGHPVALSYRRLPPATIEIPSQ